MGVPRHCPECGAFVDASGWRNCGTGCSLARSWRTLYRLERYRDALEEIASYPFAGPQRDVARRALSESGVQPKPTFKAEADLNPPDSESAEPSYPRTPVDCMLSEIHAWLSSQGYNELELSELFSRWKIDSGLVSFTFAAPLEDC